jgi:protein gp37
MADKTGIEWTDVTWNPTTGCDRISAGCDHCYAMAMAKRLNAMGQPKYQTDGDPRTSGPGFGVATHPAALRDPLKWRKPQRVFVNSMSDLFHARVPMVFAARVFAVMAATPRHTYQVLTKRPERMARTLGAGVFLQYVMGFGRDLGIGHLIRCAVDGGGLPQIVWPLPNVHLGTSIESADHVGRAEALRATPAAVRFVSAEPLLGPLSGLNLDGIGWVIVGGESGPNARPMHPDWARSLRDQCVDASVPYLFKQWGEWVDPDEIDTAGWDDVSCGERGVTIWPDGRTTHGVRGTCIDGSVTMWRVGKKTAGRMLDGRTWDQYPQTMID